MKTRVFSFLAVLLLVVFIYVRKTRVTHVDPPSAPVTVTTQPLVPTPAPLPAPTPERPTPPPAQAPDVVSNVKGVCATVATNGPLIDVRLVRRLNGTSGLRRVLLSKENASCLVESASRSFQVVRFDDRAEAIYDTLGTFGARFQVVEKYRNLADVFTSKIDLSQLAFASTAELSRWIAESGNGRGSEWWLVQVTQISQGQPRESAALTSFYPGAQVLISPPANVPVIDLRTFPREGPNKTSPLAKYWSRQTQMSPPSEVWSKVGAQAQKMLDPESTFTLLDDGPHDQRAESLASALAAKGYHHLILTTQDIVTPQDHEVTPTSWPRLRELTVAQWLESKQNFAVIDVRASIDSPSGLRWDTARVMGASSRLFNTRNYRLSVEQFYKTQQLPADFDFSPLAWTPAVKTWIAGQPVLLIGEDDYDWSPLLVAEALAKRGVNQVSWLRTGFRGLGLHKEFGLGDEWLDKNLQPLIRFENRLVQIPNGAGGTMKVVIMNARRPARTRRR